jgi:sirohydrochlorin ferrochelatase
MDSQALLSLGGEILRVAPAVCGLMIGLRFLFYNEEEWNLDGVYRRLRGGRKWRIRLSRGEWIPVSPWFTRIAGLLLLAAVIVYGLLVYGVGVQAWLPSIP